MSSIIVRLSLNASFASCTGTQPQTLKPYDISITLLHWLTLYPLYLSMSLEIFYIYFWKMFLSSNYLGVSVVGLFSIWRYLINFRVYFLLSFWSAFLVFKSLSVKQQSLSFQPSRKIKKNKNQKPHPFSPSDVWYMNVDGMFCLFSNLILIY